jgi:hypothetical protein
MATRTISQSLPQFLLPRLSWQAVRSHHHAVRAFGSLPARYVGTARLSDPSEKRTTRRFNGSHRVKSSILENPIHRRAFRATARQARDHHFDTLKFVQRLQEEGFTEAQAVAMMKVLSDVIEERLDSSQSFATLR